MLVRNLPHLIHYIEAVFVIVATAVAVTGLLDDTLINETVALAGAAADIGAGSVFALKLLLKGEAH